MIMEFFVPSVGCTGWAGLVHTPMGRVKTSGINDVDGSKGFVAVRSP